MPPLPVTPSAVLSITLHDDLNGDANVATKLYWAYSGGPPSNSDCDTIAAGVATHAGTYLGPLRSNTQSIFRIDVVDLATANGGVAQHASAVAGTLTGGVLPDVTCALMNMRIARRYRGGKPRKYFPWGDETKLNTDGRTWTTGFITLCNTNWASFVTHLNSVTGGTTNLTGPVNVSYYRGYSAPTIVNNRAKNHLAVRATPVVDSILSGSLATIIGTQRRRTQR